MCGSSLVSEHEGVSSHDPLISQYGNKLPALSKYGHYRFLGTETDPLLRYDEVYKFINKQLRFFLNRLHVAPVAIHMKLDMLRTKVFQKLTFPLSIAEISLPKLEALDILVRKMVRSWCSLPPSSAVGHFYSSPSIGGLGLKSFVDESKKLRSANMIKAMLHADVKVAAVARLSYSNALSKLCSFLPNCDAEICARQQFDRFGLVDPAVWMNLARVVKFHVKNAQLSGAWFVANEFLEKENWQLLSLDANSAKVCLLDRSKSTVEVSKYVHYNKIVRTITSHFRLRRKIQWSVLEMQGEHVRRLTSSASQGNSIPEFFTWLHKPWRLSDAEFCWQIKVTLNLIACRWNLYQWKFKPDQICQMCKSRVETPVHALNGCKSESRYAMYKHRHDAVQNVAVNAYEQSVDISSVTVDKCFRGDLVSSSLRPDIIKYDDVKKSAVIIDAKSPYLGQSFDKVHDANCSKYGFYDRRLRRLDWTASVHTLICSSSGVMPKCTRLALKALGLPAAAIKPTLELMNITCIKAGYRIRRSLGTDRKERGVIHRGRAF
jgi:hypothetical protein